MGSLYQYTVCTRIGKTCEMAISKKYSSCDGKANLYGKHVLGRFEQSQLSLRKSSGVKPYSEPPRRVRVRNLASYAFGSLVVARKLRREWWKVAWPQGQQREFVNDNAPREHYSFQ